MIETITEPPLPLGRYDVVLDENQDSVYDYCLGYSDYVLGNGSAFAFEVRTTGLDTVPNSTAFKAEESRQAEKWRGLTGGLIMGLRITEVGMALMSVGSTVASSVSHGFSTRVAVSEGAIVAADMWAMGKGLSPGYGMIQMLGDRIADKHSDLAADPPDTGYMQVVRLGAVEYATSPTGDSLPSAKAAVFSAMSEEAALTDAICSSLEKFFGAAAQPDNRFIRVQALAVKEYCDLMVESLSNANVALGELRTGVESSGLGDIVSYVDSSVAFQQRVIADGFYAEEVTLMVGAGFDGPQIDSLRAEIEGWDLENAEDGTALAYLDSAIASHLRLIPAIEELACSMQVIIDTTSLVWIPQPTAVIGGPLTGDEGSPITLDGSASSDPLNQTLTFEWDLDGDAEFDDDAGVVVSHSWPREGTRLVGLKVTDTDGYFDVSYGRVVVNPVNDGPTIVDWSPGACYVVLAGSSSQEFSVMVHDPDGDPISYEWTLDDSLVSTASSWTLASAEVDTGRYRVNVQIDDGSSLSPGNSFAWRVDIPLDPASIPGQPATDEMGLRLEISPVCPVFGSDRLEITFSLPYSGETSLRIYDVSGSHVRTLISSELQVGRHTAVWDGLDRNGRRVAPGVYVCRLGLDAEAVTRKIVLIR